MHRESGTKLALQSPGLMDGIAHLDQLGTIVQVFVGTDESSSGANVVSIVVLCHGLDREVRTVVNWLADVRRREGGVAHVQNASRLGQLRESRDVCDLHHRPVTSRCLLTQYRRWSYYSKGLNVCNLRDRPVHCVDLPPS